MRRILCRILLIVLISMFYLSIGFNAEKEMVKPELNERLCLANERLVFGFQSEMSGKMLSICISDNPSYIVYRYGTKENVELEFPVDKQNSWDQFTYSYYFRGGGRQNSGIDLNYLSFVNGHYTYKVYEEYSSMDDITLVGVKIIDKSTEEEYDIKGITTSKIGSLRYLKDSQVKR